MDLYVATATIPGDTIKDVPKAAAWLDARADALNRLYQGVLQRDPPAWDIRPLDGIVARPPNYLALQKLAEVICSDAYHRIQRGDTKGAATAISAGMRIVQNLGEQPLMASNMIRDDIECMYAPILARLPEEPDDMQRLAVETAASRRQFAATVQWEAWKIMAYLESRHLSPYVILEGMHADQRRLPPIQPLPAWLGRLLFPYYCQSLSRIDCSKSWLYQADAVHISERVGELVTSDLGSREMQASYLAHLTPFATDWTRPWLRINYTLLIREQAFVIRHARALKEAGKTGSLGEVPSVVIPGAKWQLAYDPDANTLAVKLTPIPRWATDKSVMGSAFFLLPLNGYEPLAAPPHPAEAGKAGVAPVPQYLG